MPALFVLASCQPLEIDLFRAAQDAGIGAASGKPDASDGAVIVPPGPPAPTASEVSSAAGRPPPALTPDAAPPPADTPPAPPCLAGATACQDCEASNACPLGTVCHPLSGACVSPCETASPRCPGALLCGPLGVCVECVSDSDCGAAAPVRPACITELGQCGCASDVDCGGARCDLEASTTPVAGRCEAGDD